MIEIIKTVVEKGGIYLQYKSENAKIPVGVNIVPQENGIVINFDYADVKPNPQRSALNQVRISLQPFGG